MARKIIILEKLEAPAGEPRYRYALWADVPSTRWPFFADASKTSPVKDITSQELSDLRAGKFLEKVDDARWDSARTIAQIQAALQAAHAAYQADVTAYNPFVRYGTFWDGTTWTAGGVA